MIINKNGAKYISTADIYFLNTSSDHPYPIN